MKRNITTILKDVKDQPKIDIEATAIDQDEIIKRIAELTWQGKKGTTHVSIIDNTKEIQEEG